VVVVVVILVRFAVVVDLVEVLLRRRWRWRWRWRAVAAAVCGGEDLFLPKKIFPECRRKLSGKGKYTETAQTV
jgi:hypothetical protein